MFEVTRYKKPCMTNLPQELGISIFKQILSSPVPDHQKLNDECQRLVRENIKNRKLENIKKDSEKCTFESI